MTRLWLQSVENRSALRTAIATLIAVFISFGLHLQTPYWSGMSVIIVSNLYTGSIIDKAMMRILGTIAGAFIGLFLSLWVANSLLLYLLTCFLIVAISVYYYNFSTYGYAYLLGAFCAFIVISQIAIAPQNVFFVAIWRPVEIGIGVLVAAISAYLILPNHLKDNIFIQLQDIFEVLITEFNQLSVGFSNETFIFETAQKSNVALKKKLRKAVVLIAAMRYELGISKEKIDEIRALLDIFYGLARELQYLNISAPNSDDLKVIRALPIALVFSAIQQDLLSLQAAFIHRSSSFGTLQTQLALEALEKACTPKDKSHHFIYFFILFIRRIHQNFLVIQSLLTGGPVEKVTQFKLLNKKQRLRTDVDLIKQSIKAGLSVILALSFWLISNWPGGLNGIISSLIISVRKNLFDMKNISIHRLLGCLLGGGIGLLSLSVWEMDLYSLSLIFFFSVWGFSYWMFKWQKYAYIGLQANIALIISLAQEGGPPTMIDAPLQRLGGIVIGIVASFVVANIFWRSDVWTLLNRYLSKLYKYITFNLKQVLLGPDELWLEDLTGLFWDSRSLIESLSGSYLNSKKQNKLAEIVKKFESLIIIQASISHIVLSVNKNKAHAIAGLFNFDLALCERNLLSYYEQHDIAAGLSLSQQLQKFLAKVEKQLLSSAIKENDLQNLLSYVTALNHLALRIQ